LTLTTEEILHEVEILDKQFANLRKELLKICWYMRGSVTLEQAYMMSYEEREIVSNIVKDNLEATKQSGLPFF